MQAQGRQVLISQWLDLPHSAFNISQITGFPQTEELENLLCVQQRIRERRPCYTFRGVEGGRTSLSEASKLEEGYLNRMPVSVEEVTIFVQ